MACHSLLVWNTSTLEWLMLVCKRGLLQWAQHLLCTVNLLLLRQEQCKQPHAQKKLKPRSAASPKCMAQAA
eukprot:1154880-Pelagomonas_calceolata.AAC.6